VPDSEHEAVRHEYAVLLHKLVMAYDAADWDGYEPYPGLSAEAWTVLKRDYGGMPPDHLDAR